MKTKLQILKESIVYVFVLGFTGTVSFNILKFLFGEDSWLTIGFSGLLSFVATCILMGYLFEKEKPLWLATLKYIVIGIFSALFTILLMAIGFPFMMDFLIERAGDFFKSQMAGQGIAGLLLFIPFLIISFFIVIIGIFAYVLILYFIGNLLFSFLLQWAITRFNFNFNSSKQFLQSNKTLDSDKER